MVGASVLHNLPTSRLNNLLSRHFEQSPCLVFQSDMKVRVDNAFYYPDIVVTCEEVEPASTYITQPTLVIEVLSESTEGRDRFEKRFAYQSIAGLQEYVLVTQTKFQIEIYRRIEGGWELEKYQDSDVVVFKSINFELKIEEIYQSVVKYLG